MGRVATEDEVALFLRAVPHGAGFVNYINLFVVSGDFELRVLEKDEHQGS